MLDSFLTGSEPKPNLKNLLCEVSASCVHNGLQVLAREDGVKDVASVLLRETTPVATNKIQALLFARARLDLAISNLFDLHCLLNGQQARAWQQT